VSTSADQLGVKKGSRMNRRWALPIITVAIAAGAALVTPAFGQLSSADVELRSIEWTPGRFMRQAVEDVFSTARRVAITEEYGLSEAGNCLLGAFVEPGGTVSMNFELKAGEEYFFIGGGDEDVEDLDMTLVDKDGTEVGEDRLPDAVPIVRYTPDADGVFTMNIELASADVQSFCAVIVLRKGAPNHPLEQMQGALVRSVRQAEAMGQGQAEGSKYLDVANRWALFGSLLEPGQVTTISNVSAEGRTLGFSAVGDDRVKDINLRLMSRGNQIDADADVAPSASLKRSTSKQESMDIELSVPKADGRALVILSVLEL
jgi:hypothetical protein